MAIDFGKLPVEKVFHFAANLLPGFTVLQIYDLLNPGTIRWYFATSYLGYRTKLALFLCVCFVIGYTIIAIFGTVMVALAGGLGGLWAAFRGNRDPYKDEIAPWRNSEWRAAYKVRYGSASPPDTTLVPKSMAAAICMESDLLETSTDDQPALDDLPVLIDKFQKQCERLTEVVNGVVNDRVWRMNYDRLHSRILFERKREVIEEVIEGLQSNLTVSGCIVLSCSFIVPALKQWWLIIPALGWVSVTSLVTSAKIFRVFDPWTTLSEQIEFLTTGK